MSTPISIHSILFRPDSMVEITYAEFDEMTEVVSVVRTVVISRDKFTEQVADLEAEAADLVDDALLALRNPPEKEPHRRDR